MEGQATLISMRSRNWVILSQALELKGPSVVPRFVFFEDLMMLILDGKWQYHVCVCRLSYDSDKMSFDAHLMPTLKSGPKKKYSNYLPVVIFLTCTCLFHLMQYLRHEMKEMSPPHGEAYLIVRNPRAQPISSGWRLHQWTWKPGVTTSNYLSSTWVHQWHTGLFWCSILSGLMSVKQQSKKKNYPPRQELKMHLIMHSTVWLTAHGA